MIRPGMPLRLRLSISGVLVLALALAVFGVVAYRASATAALEAALGRARATAYNLAQRAGEGLPRTFEPLAEAAADPRVKAALRNREASSEAAEALAALPWTPQTAALILRDSAGAMLLSVRDAAPTWAFDPSGPADSAHFGRLVQRDDSILYEIVVPVLDGSRRLGSVVRIAKLFASPVAVQVVSELLGEGGSLLFGNRDGSVWTDVSKPIDRAEVDEAGRTIRDDRRYVSASYPIAGTPFQFGVEFPEATVMAPVRRLGWTFAGIGVAVLAIGLLAGWLINGRVTSPLTQLADGAEAITRRYHLAHPPEAAKGDELARLQSAFRTMERSVEAAYADLEEQLREYATAVEELSPALHRLELSEEALREADRRKDDFLATLAHELRNPLAPIRNVVQIVGLTGHRGAEREWAIVDRQSRQMARLLDELLDVSRITHDRLQLRREPCALDAVIQQSIEASRPFLEAGGHTLSVSLPTEPVVLDADPARLAQVFSNLLNNSAKYTDRGGTIRIESFVRDGSLLVAVIDNGIGIAPEALPHVFDRFSPVRPTRERHLDGQSGLGIGLSLVRGLVELHGGRVEVESKVGAGSRFAVWIPLERTAGRADGRNGTMDEQSASDELSDEHPRPSLRPTV